MPTEKQIERLLNAQHKAGHSSGGSGIVRKMIDRGDFPIGQSIFERPLFSITELLIGNSEIAVRETRKDGME